MMIQNKQMREKIAKSYATPFVSINNVLSTPFLTTFPTLARTPVPDTDRRSFRRIASWDIALIPFGSAPGTPFSRPREKMGSASTRVCVCIRTPTTTGEALTEEAGRLLPLIRALFLFGTLLLVKPDRRLLMPHLALKATFESAAYGVVSLSLEGDVGQPGLRGNLTSSKSMSRSARFVEWPDVVCEVCPISRLCRFGPG